MKTEPTRQIHLDFHTSELLPAIGAQFSKQQFQDALKLGRVNQINVFAKCHHSWSYYPTRVGKPHPNLAVDLLGGQLEACREIGVRAPIYYTVGWSANDAETHPEWCMRNADGSFVAPRWPADAQPGDPKPLFQWKELCINGAYHDLIMAQVKEICELYPADCLWFDIYHPQLLCYCDRCRAGMAAEGIEIADVQQVEAYRARAIKKHCAALSQLIFSYHPQADVYFNGMNSLERPQNFRYRMFEHNTKNDLEDLPTTWGGYDKLPVRAKLFHREGKPIVAMSGKFHTAWGEFGGFKDPEAMRFEAAGMIAYGASCNFGDHLHPGGAMDMSSYAYIGQAFEYVEKIEAYGVGGLPVSRLGLWTTYDLAADEGTARMMLEAQLDFDVARAGDDLSGFETIVVPSTSGALNGAEAQLAAYLKAGGSLVVLGRGSLRSALGPEAYDATQLPLGAQLAGAGAFSPYDLDYTVAGAALRAAAGVAGAVGSAATAGSAAADAYRRADHIPVSPFLNYTPGLRFVPQADAMILAATMEPHFSRTYGAYCGHQNTPNRLDAAAHPAVWQFGRVVVFAHDIDRLYYQHGARVHRDLFLAALRRVHQRPMVEVGLPSAGRVSLLHQAEQKRYVAHLLYGSPIQRGRCLVIEDLPTLYNVPLRLRLPVAVTGLTLIPDNTPLPMQRSTAAAGTSGSGAGAGDQIVETVVPAFAAHCAVVATY